MFRGLLGFNFHIPEAVTDHPGVDPNKLGYHIEHPKADSILVAYLKTFADSFVDRPFVYFILLALAIGILCFMLSYSPGARLVLFALAAGSFLNVGIFLRVAVHAAALPLAVYCDQHGRHRGRRSILHSIVTKTPRELQKFSSEAEISFRRQDLAAMLH